MRLKLVHSIFRRKYYVKIDAKTFYILRFLYVMGVLKSCFYRGCKFYAESERISLLLSITHSANKCEKCVKSASS